VDPKTLESKAPKKESAKGRRTKGAAGNDDVGHDGEGEEPLRRGRKGNKTTKVASSRGSRGPGRVQQVVCIVALVAMVYVGYEKVLPEEGRVWVEEMKARAGASVHQVHEVLEQWPALQRVWDAGTQTASHAGPLVSRTATAVVHVFDVASLKVATAIEDIQRRIQQL